MMISYKKIKTNKNKIKETNVQHEVQNKYFMQNIWKCEHFFILENTETS